MMKKTRLQCLAKTIFSVMPKYAYHCKTCGDDFYAFHLMSEKLEKKEGCKNKKDCSLSKVPSFPINLNKIDRVEKVGDLVKQHIEEAKEDIKREKEKLKKKEFKT